MNNNSVQKLTVITRSDLTPGQQAVQSGHAALDHILLNPIEAAEWHKSSNYLIYLNVSNEEELLRISERLELASVKVTRFVEPDMNDQTTAISFFSCNSSRKLTSNLPLAFRIKKEQTSEVALA